MNFENEIDFKVMGALKNKYGFDREDVTYRYLILKCNLLKILKEDTKYFTEDIGLMNFIFDELYIYDYKYNEQPIVTYGFENNFINILDDWKFRYENMVVIDERDNKYTTLDYLSKMIKEITSFAKKETKNLKDNELKNKNELIAYFRLKKLNEIFGVCKLNEVEKLEGFMYNENFSLELSIEDKLDRYYHSINFCTSSLKTITEDDFEDYVYRHLNKIEEGLKPIERQYIIENGRIDILARDKDKKLVIIELKIANDKHLIWQVIYYPITLRSMLKEKDIRVITVCPEYPEYIETPLRQIGNIEMIKYKANISNKKIRKVEFSRI